MLTKGYSISNIAYIYDGKVQNGSISVKDNFIDCFDKSNKYDYQFDNSLVIPAFINTYDNLAQSYFPRVYSKDSDAYKEKNKLDKKTSCLLGAYRNFISGVLTVFDCGNYDIENREFIKSMPIRVLSNNGGCEVKVGISDAFIIDLAEEDRNNSKYLNDFIKVNALADNTFIVNGISLSDKDIENISKARASLVWSPISSYLMFDKMNDIKKWLDAGVNVTLGSYGNVFLEEISFAKSCYKKMYGKELHEKILYNMISDNAAKCLKLQTLGTIKCGNIADLLILRYDNNPYKTISNLTLSDIEAIVQGGRFVYANKKYSDMVYKYNEKVYTFNVLGEKRYCAYDIKGVVEKVRSIVGYIKELPFLPID